MDNHIQVCAVYADGNIRIYGKTPKGNGPRPFIRAMQFKSYGSAVQFAIDFEAQQKKEQE